MKRVICTAQINDLAANRQHELIVDAQTVITPLALDRCRELGLRVYRGSGTAGASGMQTPLVPAYSRPFTATAAQITEREVRLAVQRVLLKSFRSCFSPVLVNQVTALVLARLGERG